MSAQPSKEAIAEAQAFCCQSDVDAVEVRLAKMFDAFAAKAVAVAVAAEREAIAVQLENLAAKQDWAAYVVLDCAADDVRFRGKDVKTSSEPTAKWWQCEKCTGLANFLFVDHRCDKGGACEWVDEYGPIDGPPKSKVVTNG